MHQLGCTLVLSTYQAGKLVFLSAKDDQSLVQLPRNFEKAMGVAVHGDDMLLATRDEVLVLKNSPELARHYPRKPATYDALFMPRAVYFTGQVDIHDIDWGKDKRIFAVNTSFSCLIEVDTDYSWKPYWQPPFISHLASEDRCHLNGMAMENGLPRYVTAFSEGDTPQSWRPTVTQSGILMDVPSNEVVVRGLGMPHSPRLWQEGLFVLLSAKGQLVRIDPANGKVDVVSQLKGFVRGLARIGDYAFVGLSRLRKNSSTFAQLEIAKDADRSGIIIVHLPTGAIVGEIIYETSVDEIYDIQVLPEMTRPNILNTLTRDFKMGLDIPGATYWAPIDNNEPN